MLDNKAQEDYFEKILKRCLALEEPVAAQRGLLDEIHCLRLDRGKEKSVHGVKEVETREEEALVAVAQHDHIQPGSLSIIVQAMRKLREALVATNRVNDGFACKAYVFTIRATVLLRHAESYHPALLHLLHRMHTKFPLPADTFGQMTEYYLLDLGCRQRDLHTAYQISCQHAYRNSTVKSLLQALVIGNWTRFFALRDTLDQFQVRLVEAAREYIMQHATVCIAKTYFVLDKSYFENTFRKNWEVFRSEQAVNWTSSGDTVIVRQTKRK